MLLSLAVGVGWLPRESRAEESLGSKIKQIFEPTPPPTKRKKTSTTKKKVLPTPSPTPRKRAASDEEASPSPSPKVSPKPTATPSVTPDESPTPKAKHSPSPSPSPKKGKKKTSSSPTPTPKETASPEPSVTPSPSPSASPSPSVGETPRPSPSPEGKKERPAGVSISPDDIVGFEQYPAPVRKLIEDSLHLVSQNLSYKYGSSDPASGGLDCSGFIYHVLRENGVTGVPRDSSQQYVWVRKGGKFEAVMSRKDDSFELEALKPGDLLFWTGTYDIDRDPPITHAMIYVGKEKSTGRRVMVGASDGRTYHDESRYGVSVFDFKISRSAKATTSGRTPTFVGYGRIPGLAGEAGH
ncbi:MAG: C40 family peptidase [Chthoniobacterales bacterium]